MSMTEENEKLIKETADIRRFVDALDFELKQSPASRASNASQIDTMLGNVSDNSINGSLALYDVFAAMEELSKRTKEIEDLTGIPVEEEDGTPSASAAASASIAFDPADMPKAYAKKLTQASSRLLTLFGKGKKNYSDLLHSLSMSGDNAGEPSVNEDMALVPILQQKINGLRKELEILEGKNRSLNVQWIADRQRLNDIAAKLKDDNKRLSQRLVVSENRNRYKEQLDRDENMVESALGVSKADYEIAIEENTALKRALEKADGEMSRLSADVSHWTKEARNFQESLELSMKKSQKLKQKILNSAQSEGHFKKKLEEAVQDLERCTSEWSQKLAVEEAARERDIAQHQELKNDIISIREEGVRLRKTIEDLESAVERERASFKVMQTQLTEAQQGQFREVSIAKDLRAQLSKLQEIEEAHSNLKSTYASLEYKMSQYVTGVGAMRQKLSVISKSHTDSVEKSLLGSVESLATRFDSLVENVLYLKRKCLADAETIAKLKCSMENKNGTIGSEEESMVNEDSSGPSKNIAHMISDASVPVSVSYLAPTDETGESIGSSSNKEMIRTGKAIVGKIGQLLQIDGYYGSYSDSAAGAGEELRDTVHLLLEERAAVREGECMCAEDFMSRQRREIEGYTWAMLDDTASSSVLSQYISKNGTTKNIRLQLEEALCSLILQRGEGELMFLEDENSRMVEYSTAVSTEEAVFSTDIVGTESGMPWHPGMQSARLRRAPSIRAGPQSVGNLSRAMSVQMEQIDSIRQTLQDPLMEKAMVEIVMQQIMKTSSSMGIQVDCTELENTGVKASECSSVIDTAQTELVAIDSPISPDGVVLMAPLPMADGIVASQLHCRPTSLPYAGQNGTDTPSTVNPASISSAIEVGAVSSHSISTSEFTDALHAHWRELQTRILELLELQADDTSTSLEMEEMIRSALISSVAQFGEILGENHALKERLVLLSTPRGRSDFHKSVTMTAPNVSDSQALSENLRATKELVATLQARASVAEEERLALREKIQSLEEEVEELQSPGSSNPQLGSQSDPGLHIENIEEQEAFSISKLSNAVIRNLRSKFGEASASYSSRVKSAVDIAHSQIAHFKRNVRARNTLRRLNNELDYSKKREGEDEPAHDMWNSDRFEEEEQLVEVGSSLSLHALVDQLVFRLLTDKRDRQAIALAEAVLEAQKAWSEGDTPISASILSLCREVCDREEDLALISALSSRMRASMDFTDEIRETRAKLDVMLKLSKRVKLSWPHQSGDADKIYGAVGAAKSEVSAAKDLKTVESVDFTDDLTLQSSHHQASPDMYTPLVNNESAAAAPINGLASDVTIDVVDVPDDLTIPDDLTYDTGDFASPTHSDARAAATVGHVNSNGDSNARGFRGDAAKNVKTLLQGVDKAMRAKREMDEELMRQIAETLAQHAARGKSTGEAEIQTDMQEEGEGLGSKTARVVSAPSIATSRMRPLPPGFHLVHAADGKVELYPGVMLASICKAFEILDDDTSSGRYVDMMCAVGKNRDVVYCYVDDDACFDDLVPCPASRYDMPRFKNCEAILLPPSLEIAKGVKLITNFTLPARIDLPPDIYVVQLVGNAALPSGLTRVDLEDSIVQPSGYPPLPPKTELVQMNVMISLPPGVEVHRDCVTVELPKDMPPLPPNMCLIKRNNSIDLPSFMEAIPKLADGDSEIMLFERMKQCCVILNKPEHWDTHLGLGVELIYRPSGFPMPRGMTPLPLSQHPPSDFLTGRMPAESIELVQLTPKFDLPSTFRIDANLRYFPRRVGSRLPPNIYLFQHEESERNYSPPSCLCQVAIPSTVTVPIPSNVFAAECLASAGRPLPYGSTLAPGVHVISITEALGGKAAREQAELLASRLPVNAVFARLERGAVLPSLVSRSPVSPARTVAAGLLSGLRLVENVELLFLSVRFEIPAGVALESGVKLGWNTQMCPGTILSYDLRVTEWPPGLSLTPGTELVQVSMGCEIPSEFEIAHPPLGLSKAQLLSLGLDSHHCVIKLPASVRTPHLPQIMSKIAIARDINSLLKQHMSDTEVEKKFGKITDCSLESLPPGTALIIRDREKTPLPSEISVISLNALPQELSAEIDRCNNKLYSGRSGDINQVMQRRTFLGSLSGSEAFDSGAEEALTIEPVQLTPTYAFPVGTILAPGVVVLARPFWLQQLPHWLELVTSPEAVDDAETTAKKSDAKKDEELLTKRMQTHFVYLRPDDALTGALLQEAYKPFPYLPRGSQLVLIQDNCQIYSWGHCWGIQAVNPPDGLYLPPAHFIVQRSASKAEQLPHGLRVGFYPSYAHLSAAIYNALPGASEIVHLEPVFYLPKFIKISNLVLSAHPAASAAEKAAAAHGGRRDSSCISRLDCRQGGWTNYFPLCQLSAGEIISPALLALANPPGWTTGSINTLLMATSKSKAHKERDELNVSFIFVLVDSRSKYVLPDGASIVPNSDEVVDALYLDGLRLFEDFFSNGLMKPSESVKLLCLQKNLSSYENRIRRAPRLSTLDASSTVPTENIRDGDVISIHPRISMNTRIAVAGRSRKQSGASSHYSNRSVSLYHHHNGTKATNVPRLMEKMFGQESQMLNAEKGRDSVSYLSVLDSDTRRKRSMARSKTSQSTKVPNLGEEVHDGLKNFSQAEKLSADLVCPRVNESNRLLVARVGAEVTDAHQPNDGLASLSQSDESLSGVLLLANTCDESSAVIDDNKNTPRPQGDISSLSDPAKIETNGSEEWTSSPSSPSCERDGKFLPMRNEKGTDSKDANGHSDERDYPPFFFNDPVLLTALGKAQAEIESLEQAHAGALQRLVVLQRELEKVEPKLSNALALESAFENNRMTHIREIENLKGSIAQRDSRHHTLVEDLKDLEIRYTNLQDQSDEQVRLLRNELAACLQVGDEYRNEVTLLRKQSAHLATHAHDRTKIGLTAVAHMFIDALKDSSTAIMYEVVKQTGYSDTFKMLQKGRRSDVIAAAVHSGLSTDISAPIKLSISPSIKEHSSSDQTCSMADDASAVSALSRMTFESSTRSPMEDGALSFSPVPRDRDHNHLLRQSPSRPRPHSPHSPAPSQPQSPLRLQPRSPTRHRIHHSHFSQLMHLSSAEDAAEVYFKASAHMVMSSDDEISRETNSVDEPSHGHGHEYDSDGDHPVLCTLSIPSVEDIIVSFEKLTEPIQGGGGDVTFEDFAFDKIVQTISPKLAKWANGVAESVRLALVRERDTFVRALMLADLEVLALLRQNHKLVVKCENLERELVDSMRQSAGEPLSTGGLRGRISQLELECDTLRERGVKSSAESMRNLVESIVSLREVEKSLIMRSMALSRSALKQEAHLSKVRMMIDTGHVESSDQRVHHHPHIQDHSSHDDEVHDDEDNAGNKVLAIKHHIASLHTHAERYRARAKLVREEADSLNSFILKDLQDLQRVAQKVLPSRILGDLLLWGSRRTQELSNQGPPSALGIISPIMGGSVMEAREILGVGGKAGGTGSSLHAGMNASVSAGRGVGTGTGGMAMGMHFDDDASSVLSANASVVSALSVSSATALCAAASALNPLANLNRSLGSTGTLSNAHIGSSFARRTAATFNVKLPDSLAPSSKKRVYLSSLRNSGREEEDAEAAPTQQQRDWSVSSSERRRDHRPQQFGSSSRGGRTKLDSLLISSSSSSVSSRR